MPNPIIESTEGNPVTNPKDSLQQSAEAAAFRRLIAHLQTRNDVQNIDLMNLAGFCRNCLGDWYREAMAAQGVELDKNQGREHIYGMPVSEWKARHQTEASAEAKAAFAEAAKHD